MAVARDERHRYGQHYTPPAVARLLAAFAVRTSDDLVFDPACGDGRLLAEAIAIKEHLSSGHRRCAQQVFGVDRSAEAVALARQTGAQVMEADFFDLEPGQSADQGISIPDACDAIIGNPPYIRQEFISAVDKRRIGRRLAKDRELEPGVHWPRWSGRSDIYVYFFARAVRFLRPGGRLAFLTASSWLDAGYGGPLREFLLRNFRIIAVIESAAESFFAEASINTSITVLERQPGAARPASVTSSPTARFVRLTHSLEQYLGNGRNPATAALEFARSIEQAATRIPTPKSAIHNPQSAIERSAIGSIRTTPLTEAATGWGKYLRADDIFFRVLDRGGARLLPLANLADVRFGVKTGANAFFYVEDAGPNPIPQPGDEESPLLALKDVAHVRRGLTTGANAFFYLKPVMEYTSLTRHSASAQGDLFQMESNLPFPGPIAERLIEVMDAAGERHMIEERFLAPVVFSLKEIPSILLTRVSSKRLLFNCPLAPGRLQETGALSYIRVGERAGYHRRPSCATRSVWYALPGKRQPAPLIFPAKVGERWLIAINQAGVFEDKKLYGVYPRRGISHRLLAALLNSTWARYCVEVTCRQMTGSQAIADIDVAVAAQIIIPDPRRIPAALAAELEAALEAIAPRAVTSVFEEVERADRHRLDELVLEAAGFANPAERRAALDDLYGAVTRMVRARLEKSG